MVTQPSNPPSSRAVALTIPDTSELATCTGISNAREVKPRIVGILTRLTGFEAGRVFRLDGPGPHSIGRSRENDVRLEDTSLSRKHARIIKDSDSFIVEDVGSRNGTFVNAIRVDKATLKDGDRVGLGTDVTCRFQLVDEDEYDLLQRVYESSINDGLTGMYNRKYIDERLNAEVAYAQRHGEPLSFLLLDIDHFKLVNDTYGHAAGDAVLRAVAFALRSALRTEDVLGRFGGEEIAVIARGTPLSSAARLAERLRQVVAQLKVTSEQKTISVTVSAGVASLSCCKASQPTRELLFEIADNRLYRAKANGRNQICAEL